MAPRFTILATTPQHLKHGGIKKEDIIGKGIFEVYPRNPNNPTETAENNLQASLNHVVQYKEPHKLSMQRYDVADEEGRFVERYWQAEHKPILAPDGEVAYIFITVEELTDQVKAEKKEEVHQELRKAYDKIEKSETALKQFKFMADQAQDPFILMREDGTFAYLNTKALEAWGFTAEEAAHLRVPDVDPIYNDEVFSAAFVKAQQDEIPAFETLHRRKDGYIYPVEVRMGGLMLNDEPHMFAVARNIAERRQAEEALRESETRFRSMIEQAPIAILLTRGEDLVIESINAPMLRMMNKSSIQEVLGKKMLEVLPELEGQPALQTVLNVQKTGIPFRGDEQPLDLIVDEELQRHYFNFSYTPIIEKGNVVAVLHVAVDVREQVLARRKIEESEGRFRLLADASPNLIWMLNTDGSYQYVNKTTLHFLNITQKQIAAVGWEAFQHPDDLEPAKQALVKALQSQQPYEMEHRMLHKSGEYRWVLSQAIPAFDAKRNVFAYVGSSIDIHEAKKSRKELVTALEQVRLSKEAAELGTFDLDMERGTMHWDYRCRTLFGISHQAPVSYEDDFIKRLHPGDLERVVEVISRAFDKSLSNGNYDVEYRTIGAEDGIVRWVRAKGKVYFTDQGKQSRFIGSVLDITPQVSARKKVEESEQRFRKLADESPIFVFIIDADPLALVSYWNKPWLDYTGQTAEEALGRAWNGIIHPDDIPIVMKHYTPAFGSKEPYFIPAVRVKRQDGVYRWHSFKGNPRYLPNGEFGGYVGVGFDINEQKVTEEGLEEMVVKRTEELQRINKELQRSNANLEEFAHAASHDLKEPIRKISFFSHQLKDQLSDRLRENEKFSLGRIENATERMGNLIDDLLLYSHVSQRPHQMEAVDLNVKVQRVLEDLELDIQEKKAVIQVDKLPVVQGYRRQLQQLFQNLLSNALKYSKANVPPHIDISAEKVQERNRNYLVVVVKDNGIGFEQQYSEKIFQMFARLHGKAEYSGTGVGLSIVKKVVENHNGFIKVESVVDKGSVFKIYLPV